MAVPTITPTDRRFYYERLRAQLPDRIVDGHAHVWYDTDLLPEGSYPARRSAAWAARIAATNPLADLAETYRRLFPGKQVTPAIFGNIDTNVDILANNAHVAADARISGLPALAVSHPNWTAAEFEQRVLDGGFAGCKPYLNFAPTDIPSAEIEIFDFLPRTHLEVADRHGWVVMLHIPRPGRLGDPVNLRQLAEIDRDYPHARVIVTHIGRAYALEDIGEGMNVLAATRNLLFDITANTNTEVMRRLLDVVDPGRVLFGSDLPIFGLRGHRVVENGRYLNIVPRGLYGDVSDDPTMRETDDADGLTLMLYEEIAAFLDAADAAGLSRAQRDAVFYDNAVAVYGPVSPTWRER
ncbi:MAG: amidohydrolase family protein [Propionicimonas sp.]|uniref:amidohydrolase family protein n=1 Tax=Propionicimonas sp. TaxID=1955623 RepID=UPI002B1FAF66|nr:amidohydrolase family protein [Propionicimonas sp.]MEA4945672.1 amidohydrolase family protein [Propionicimonas sp.]